MINSVKDFQDIVNSLLMPLGFVKKKNTWYFETDDCICFFYLGTSRSVGIGEMMGCFLKEIMEVEEKFPLCSGAHLRYSLEYYENPEFDSTILRLDKPVFDAVREDELKRAIVNFAIPFLDAISTREGITETAKKIPRLKHYMFGDFRKALGIKLDE